MDSGAAIARQTIRVLPEETEARGVGGQAFLTSPPEHEADLALVLRRYGFPDVQSVAIEPMDTTSAPTAP